LKLINISCLDWSRPSPSSPRLPVWGPVQSDLPVRPDRTEPYPRLGPSGLVESLYIYGLVAFLDSRIKLLAISISTTQSALPPLPTRLVTKHTPLPLCRKVPGMHSPLWMESRVGCFLCRWRRSQGGSGEGMKTSIKCEDCNEALCFTPKRNCFYEFQHM